MEAGSEEDSAAMGHQCFAKVCKRVLEETRYSLVLFSSLFSTLTGFSRTHRDLGIEVRDFGVSWRDGNAFLGIIDAIKSNVVSVPAMRQATNRIRLETAFNVAENELGIARLLDPEDVDVPQPDEKCIMTYVAQFLHKYPEPKGTGSDSFAAVQQEYDLLLRWLNDKTRQLDQLDRNGGFPNDYEVGILRIYFFFFYCPCNDSLFSRVVAIPHVQERSRREVDNLLQVAEFGRGAKYGQHHSGVLEAHTKFVESLGYACKFFNHFSYSINNIFTNKYFSQMLRWLWLLDSSLPGELGDVGRWLAHAESLLHSDDDIPEEMTEETASIISQKLEEHKKFFLDLPSVVEKFNRARSSPLARQVPSQQLDNISSRLDSLPIRAAKRRIKLKFLEHKCCLVAFLYLVETRLKSWSIKYGNEEDVQNMLEQYRNFVSRNRIFQEFQKAYLDMQQVVEEYKKEGDIGKSSVQTTIFTLIIVVALGNYDDLQYSFRSRRKPEC